MEDQLPERPEAPVRKRNYRVHLGYQVRMSDATPPDPTDSDLRPGDVTAADTEGAGENLCPRCSGSGRSGDGECPVCSGTGRVTEGIGGA